MNFVSFGNHPYHINFFKMFYNHVTFFVVDFSSFFVVDFYQVYLLHFKNYYYNLKKKKKPTAGIDAGIEILHL